MAQYTPNTTVRGATNRAALPILKKLARDMGSDNLSDVLTMLDTTFSLAAQVGLRGELMAVQSILETRERRDASGRLIPWSSQWWRDRLNPAGLGITGDPAQNAASHRFRDGDESARALVTHMAVYAIGEMLPRPLRAADDPRYTAVIQAGTAGTVKVLNDLSGKWAADRLYGEKIADLANDLGIETNDDPVGGDPVTVKPENLTAFQKALLGRKVLLSGGHRNTTRGGAYREIDWTMPVTRKLAAAFRKAGWTADILQELDGDNDPNFQHANLDHVGQKAVQLDKTRGPYGLFFSQHYEGVAVSGCFGIPPGSQSADRQLISFRTRIRDNELLSGNGADLAFCRIASAKVAGVKVNGRSIPQRRGGVIEPGVMAEWQTGVGGSGWRLSELYESLPIRDHCARVIFEAGTYGVQNDRDLLWLPAWQDAYCDAIVAAAEAWRAEWLAGVADTKPVPVPTPDPKYADPITPAWLTDLILTADADAPKKNQATDTDGTIWTALNDTVEALSELPRRQLPKIDSPVINEPIDKGERFSVGAVATIGGKVWGKTRWGTCVPMDQVKTISDRPDAL